MNSVKVKRNDLLEILRKNRGNHRSIFEKAQVVFRTRVIEELDKMLAAVRNGDAVSLRVNLPQPEDHTDDYDNAIAMLDMSVDAEIEIEAHDFQQFVRDQWGWQRSFAANTMSYAGTTP